MNAVAIAIAIVLSTVGSAAGSDIRFVATGPIGIGPIGAEQAVILPSADENPCPGSDLYCNHDGTFDGNGYAWQYGGVVPPYYGAFAEGYVLDARRCLSYLTIEIRGGIPAEQRPSLGAHVFGCDICQDVCPYNAVAPLAKDACWLPRAELADAGIARLWALDDSGLERAIEGTALRRAGVRGLRRNLAVAIGNAGPPLTSVLDSRGVPGATPAETARDDARPSLQDPMVAEHISWARSRSQ